MSDYADQITRMLMGARNGAGGQVGQVPQNPYEQGFGDEPVYQNHYDDPMMSRGFPSNNPHVPGSDRQMPGPNYQGSSAISNAAPFYGMDIGMLAGMTGRKMAGLQRYGQPYPRQAPQQLMGGPDDYSYPQE